MCAGETVPCVVAEDPLRRSVFGSSERVFVVSEFEIPALGLV